MKENECWGLVILYRAAGSSGSVFLHCERASLNLEPRLLDEPWPLILIANFPKLTFPPFIPLVLFNVQIMAGISPGI